jgi:2-haloacid dehalogenase
MGHYKPDLEVYDTAARLLGWKPSQVLMVAAHPSDLAAAQRAGLRTAYVRRPLEHGPDAPAKPHADKRFDVVVDSFLELADQLDAAAHAHPATDPFTSPYGKAPYGPD